MFSKPRFDPERHLKKLVLLDQNPPQATKEFYQKRILYATWEASCRKVKDTPDIADVINPYPVPDPPLTQIELEFAEKNAKEAVADMEKRMSSVTSIYVEDIQGASGPLCTPDKKCTGELCERCFCEKLAQTAAAENLTQELVDQMYATHGLYWTDHFLDTTGMSELKSKLPLREVD